MVAYPDSKDQSHLTREFIRGLLNSKVREEVVLHSDGKTYEEVVAKARDAEAGYAYLATLNRTSRPVDNFPGAPPRVSLAAPEPMDMGSLNAILATVQGLQRDKTGRFIKDGCWECGDKSHMKRNCPKLPPTPAWNGRGRGYNRGRGGGGRGRGWGNRGGANSNNANRVLGSITDPAEETQQVQAIPAGNQTTETMPDFIQQQQQLMQSFNPAMGNF
jgi:hypothetical protein